MSLMASFYVAANRMRNEMGLDRRRVIMLTASARMAIISAAIATRPDRAADAASLAEYEAERHARQLDVVSPAR